MKFEVDHVDYSVSEFFEVFKEKLPRIVTVTQGFHGDISDDIFDREGVCYFLQTQNITSLFPITNVQFKCVYVYRAEW